MSLLITITALTLGISALCSLFEAVLYSTRMGALEAAKTGSKKDRSNARHMIDMKANIAQPITAILVLNTVANTAGANLAGVISADVLGPVGVVVFPVFLVLGILFLSELIPKTAGAVYWRSLWQLIVWPLIFLRGLLTPMVWIIQHMTDLLTRGALPAVITEDEILALVRLGASEGHISEEESEMVRNIIDMENKVAKDVMTPRVVVYSLDAETPLSKAVEEIRTVGFTRIPIFNEHSENITGYVVRRDLYAALETEPARPLHALAKPIAFVPETANCLTLLNQFLKHRRHIAMVTDEYGGLAGLVTLEDLIETVLGSEIVDETDSAVDMQSVARARKHEQNLRQGPTDAPADREQDEP